MLYAIIALAALAALCGWLAWRCVALRGELAKSRSRVQSLQKDRAIRQNLQHLLDRRDAELRRLREKLEAFENDYHEMESRASDLNVSLFRESGLRILAEKEDGAKRLKMEQLERQVEDANKKLRALRAEAEANEKKLLGQIADQEKEVARLRQANARRMKRPATDPALMNQVTLDEVISMKTED